MKVSGLFSEEENAAIFRDTVKCEFKVKTTSRDRILTTFTQFKSQDKIASHVISPRDAKRVGGVRDVANNLGQGVEGCFGLRLCSIRRARGRINRERGFDWLNQEVSPVQLGIEAGELEVLKVGGDSLQCPEYSCLRDETYVHSVGEWCSIQTVQPSEDTTCCLDGHDPSL
jgi:hypothetical protein